jgi:heme/copper-type cytochrome/quinol oxidase subunit 2
MARSPSLRLLEASAALALFGGIVVGWVSAPGVEPGPNPGTTTDPGPPGVHAQELSERSFAVAARKYTFAPTIIEVNQDDVVRITLTTDDIPHSFTIDKYRIAKRVEPGRPVVFEFRADQPGRFPIYCNLSIDEKCREMRGELVVTGRR